MVPRFPLPRFQSPQGGDITICSAPHNYSWIVPWICGGTVVIIRPIKMFFVRSEGPVRHAMKKSFQLGERVCWLSYVCFTGPRTLDVDRTATESVIVYSRPTSTTRDAPA